MSKSTAVAVFDISSSSVGGAHALVEQKDSKNAITILVQDRRDSGLEEEINIERFVESTAKTLGVVIDHVRTADVHQPKAIQVILGSPWYTAYSRTIVYTKTTVFSCTERLVESLIEKELQYLLKQDDGNGSPLSDSYKVAEQQVSRFVLNGYETADPYGKKAQRLEIMLQVALIPSIVSERFTSILRRSYGNRKIHVTTGLNATLVALRDNGGIESHAAILDVGEEVTDVAIVRNNQIMSQYSFPGGSYELYRALSSVTGSIVEARSLIEGYRLKKLSPGSVRTVERALQLFAQRWQQALHTAVESDKNGFRFPSQCYVVADHRFETVFSAVMSADPFLLHSAAAQHITVHFVNTLNLNADISVVSTEEPDTTLAIGALFIERLL